MSKLDSKKIQAQLKAFRENPREAMSQYPEKIIQQDEMAFGTAFSIDDIENKRYLEARTALRKTISETNTLTESLPPIESVEHVVDAFKFNRLQTLHEEKLTQAKLPKNPWSDDYWAICQGVLGKRYSNPYHSSSANWQENKDYIDNNPAITVLQNTNLERINALSPSEKYDALIGDPQARLTKAMWAEGEIQQQQSNGVETWRGISHGWALAAYQLPRPQTSVTLITPDGHTPIIFYPSDIKALATLLWAKYPPKIHRLGVTCNNEETEKSIRSGDNVSEKCFGLNPAVWHLTVVHQLGVSQQSFIVDAYYDYEIWNQPALSYEYTYFNLNTDQITENIEEAMLPLKGYENDPFKQHRNSKTKHIIGIAMAFDYMVETLPKAEDNNTADKDAIHRVHYYYDLELDDAGVIIGGEWHTNYHPDFLWTSVQHEKAVSDFEEQAVESWAIRDTALPFSWQEAAKQATQQQHVPLAKIIDQLLIFSRNQT